MPKFFTKEREYLVTMHYIQHFKPFKIGNHTKTIKAKSPIDTIDKIIWCWREVDVENRIYIEDIKVVIVVDVDTKILWIFCPKMRLTKDDFDENGHQCKPGHLIWKKVLGPTYISWKKRFDVK